MSTVAPKTVAQEAANTKIPWAAGFPAPEILHVQSDRLAMRKIPGPTMESKLRSPKALHHLSYEFGRLHAQMQQCSGWGLPEQRQSMMDALREAPDVSQAVKEKLLVSLLTEQSESAMCHGDYHPGNILLSPQGPIVIDWADATKGHAVADVARTLLLLQGAVQGNYGRPQWMKPVVVYLIRRYKQGYRSLRPLDDGDIKTWMPLVAVARLREGIHEEEHYLRSWLSI